MLAGVEVAADQRRVDAQVERGRVEGDEPAFPVTGHGDLGPWTLNFRFFGIEPVHCGEHFLHFIADDVPAEFVGLAVDPFAMRQVGEAFQFLVARPGILAVGERQREHLAPIFGQAAGKLRVGR